jgi:hypothetical protein
MPSVTVAHGRVQTQDQVNSTLRDFLQFGWIVSCAGVLVKNGKFMP